MIGSRLGNYEIVAEIGRGGMGVVYEAEDTRLQRRVALKVLPAELAADPAGLERFEREARAVAALNHPNIVTVHSVEEAEGRRFITMELVRGRPLSELVATGGMPLREVLALAQPLADALAAAHAAGITHRDLKPANVMVDAEGRVKVLDFGLAKWQAAPAAPDDLTVPVEAPVTGEGQILGTVPYMSPEQLEGKAVDHRSDIFTLGIILYELVAGRRPFGGDSSAAVMSSILRDDPVPLAAAQRELPRQLGRIVGRCLQKHPEDRYQTARGVRNDLRDLEQELKQESGVGLAAPAAPAAQAVPATPATPAAPAAPADGDGPRRRLWAWLVPLAALAVVAAALIGWPRGGEETAPTGQQATADARQMIVVLPFENLGASDDDYFADGLTEEITSRLATLPGLGVISRTSAMQFKDERPPLREIGRQLGVDYVLEGTVRWERRADGSNRVRVTPQLIRVADDTHLWADRYDRQLEEIFAVQGDIAAAVARQLNVTLLEPQRAALQSRPTENMEAYQAFLRGSELWSHPGYDAGRFRLAREMFERAAQLDPDFVEALTELANVNAMLFRGGDAGEEALEASARAIARAEAVAPEHPDVHLAKGYYYYLGYFDFERALAELALVEEARPDDPAVHEAIGYIRRRQGRLDEAVARLERAARLDPRNAHVILMLAGTHGAQRHHAAADSLYDLAIALEPDSPEAYLEKADNVIAWRGDVAAARAITAGIPGRSGGLSRMTEAWYDQLDRDYEAAARRLGEVDPAELPGARVRAEYYNLHGDLLRALGREDEARATYQLGITSLEGEATSGNSSHMLVSGLAMLHARLGHLDRARALAQEARERRPDDRFYEINGEIWDAAIAMAVGDAERSIGLLASLLEREYFLPLSVAELRLDPLWDPLRDDPRFQALLVSRAAGES